MAHVGMQGLHSLVAGNGPHLRDISGCDRADDIIGKTASLAHRRGVDMPTDAACGTADQTA